LNAPAQLLKALQGLGITLKNTNEGSLSECRQPARLTHEVTDVRTDSGIPEAYPDFAEKIAHAVQRSMLIYGSGVEVRPALALAI
jgi:hypothetical protein